MDHKRWRRLLATVLVAALTACGGGGGGGSSSGGEVPADTTPDTFAFTAQVDAPLSTLVESDPITVSGINAAAPVSVAGGEYSIDGADFTGAAGTVTQGQAVRVRLTSADALATSAVATLTIGGVAGEFLVTTQADNTASVAAVLFPTPRSFTTRDSILVRGTAADGQGSEIVSVSVNGVQAQSDDGFTTWTARVPLQFGSNTLTVETRDRLNTDTAAASVEVISRTDPELVYPTRFALDSANNRALVTDPLTGRLFAVALDTGTRSILSGTDPASDGDGDGAKIGSGPAFGYPQAVDLASGNRSVVSGEDGSKGGAEVGTGRGFLSPLDLALDPDNNRAFVVDGAGTAGTILSVDLDTGDRQVFSGGTNLGDEMVSSGPLLSQPRSVEFDGSNNRLVVVDQQLGLLFIDLVDGGRQLVDERIGSGPQLAGLLGPGFDSVRKRIVATDYYLRAIVAVDPATGVRSVLSAGDVGIGPEFPNPYNVALDRGNDRVLAVDVDLDAVFSVDPVTGDRVILSDDSQGFGPVFDFPRTIDVDSENNRILVGDSEVEAIFAVDPGTGDRTIISGKDPDNGNATVGSGPALGTPESLVWDAKHNRMLILNYDSSNYEYDLMAVDFETGNRTLLTDSGMELGYISSFALDSDNNCVLLVSYSQNAVIAMDLDTGNRHVISGVDPQSGTIVGGGPPLDAPVTATIDSEKGLLYINSAADAIVVMDLQTGERAVVSDGARLNSGSFIDV